MVFAIFRQPNYDIRLAQVGQFNQVYHYSTIDTIHVPFVFHSYPIWTRTIVSQYWSCIIFHISHSIRLIYYEYMIIMNIIRLCMYVYIYESYIQQIDGLICWDSPCSAFPQVPEASSKEFPAPDGRSDLGILERWWGGSVDGWDKSGEIRGWVCWT